MLKHGLPFLRLGPVHFQPLEWELEAVRAYFRGKVLNAGCGLRDITPLLATLGAESVVNADLLTNIHGAVICNLASLPFNDGLFDSVLCNAVLEHVDSLEAVMEELLRVLRPGGHLILVIPFLQPYHEAPRDFRRYTGEGMKQLGDKYGLKTVAVYPVHTIAQTLGWILWEYLLERGSTPFKAVGWPLIWLATRWSCRSDLSRSRTANAFQSVYLKPQ